MNRSFTCKKAVDGGGGGGGGSCGKEGKCLAVGRTTQITGSLDKKAWHQTRAEKSKQVGKSV